MPWKELRVKAMDKDHKNSEWYKALVMDDRLTLAKLIYAQKEQGDMDELRNEHHKNCKNSGLSTIGNVRDYFLSIMKLGNRIVWA